MEVTTPATVRTWSDEEGWGVLDSNCTPGGCWTHFSAVDFDGYRALTVGQTVSLTAESGEQDGFQWRALRVLVEGRSPAAVTDTDVSRAYTSRLSIAWDDDAE